MAELRDQAHAEQLGALLARLRDAAGYSQNKAAKRLGLAQSRLSDYERGADPHSGRPTFPPPEALRAMARLYGYPERELLLLGGWMPRAVREEEAGRIRRFLDLLPEQQQRALELSQHRAAEEGPGWEAPES